MGALTLTRPRTPRLCPSAGERLIPACFSQVGAFVFDLENVLYDATVWRRWLLRLLARLGFRFDYAEFFAVWDRDYLPEVYCGRRDYEDAFENLLADCGLSPAQIDEVAAASHARRRELARSRRLLPGVVRTLGQLHAGGVPLAILCEADAPAMHVRDELQRLAIGSYFGPIITSFDLGSSKPDPACFHAVLAALELASDRVTFVGHEARELSAARQLGMPTVAFNCEAKADADLHCLHFPELLELVPACTASSRHARARSRQY